jgi:nucleoside-diphosphate-sugar epimerase
MKCGENVMNQPQGLIKVLLDVTAAEADRDDAAMDLAVYDEPEVEEALIHVGADPSTPNSVAASCGESLAEIWIRKKTLNLYAFKRLQGEACNEALGLIRVREPSWASKIG